MKVVIGTKNPAKILAVKKAFEHHPCDFTSLDVPSGISAQPFSDEETIQGAINRALKACELGEGDIGIGLEGGVEETSFGLFLCNWGALVEKNGVPFIAGGARIKLPEDVAARLRAGEELGPVMDDFAGKENVRKNEGAVGIFTNGQINRSDMFAHVMKLLVGQFEYSQLNKRR